MSTTKQLILLLLLSNLSAKTVKLHPFDYLGIDKLWHFFSCEPLRKTTISWCRNGKVARAACTKKQKKASGICVINILNSSGSESHVTASISVLKCSFFPSKSDQIPFAPLLSWTQLSGWHNRNGRQYKEHTRINNNILTAMLPF